MQYRNLGNTDLLVYEIGFYVRAINGRASIGSTAADWIVVMVNNFKNNSAAGLTKNR